MSLICFSSINFFPSIPQPINQLCCSACNGLWGGRLWLYEVNAAHPFHLHGLKFYVCCSFLLCSSAKNYLGNKTKTQAHFSLKCLYMQQPYSRLLFPNLAWGNDLWNLRKTASPEGFKEISQRPPNTASPPLLLNILRGWEGLYILNRKLYLRPQLCAGRDAVCSRNEGEFVH